AQETNNPDTVNPSSSHKTKVSQDALSLVEQRLFCAIVNDFSLVNQQEEECILDYMANPLRDILKKGFVLYNLQQKSFDTFFDTLSEDEKLLVSRLINEQSEKISVQTFNNLFLQLKRHRWRNMVKIIQKQLIEAKKKI